MSTIQYQPQTINYNILTVHNKLYNNNCTLSTVHCQLFTVNWTLSTVHYKLHTVLSSLCTVELTVYSFIHTLFVNHCWLLNELFYHQLYSVQFYLHCSTLNSVTTTNTQSRKIIDFIFPVPANPCNPDNRYLLHSWIHGFGKTIQEHFK